MSEGPVFYQAAIERNAPAVLSCLARIVNELLLETAKGTQFQPALKVELGNAVALIMKATAPPKELAPPAGGA
jgi:hypothetical protein